MVELSRVARPRTRAEIEEIAWNARAYCGIQPFEQVPVAPLIENVLRAVLPGYDVFVAPPGSLGAVEAVTHASRPHITFCEKTYNDLYRERPRARMTAIHEMGHLLLHTGQYAYAFMKKYDPLVDPEKQADMFASAFMMPECAFRRVASIEEAMRTFGVSRDAACYRARTLGLYRKLVIDRGRSTQKRKGRKPMVRTP